MARDISVTTPHDNVAHQERREQESPDRQGDEYEQALVDEDGLLEPATPVRSLDGESERSASCYHHSDNNCGSNSPSDSDRGGFNQGSQASPTPITTGGPEDWAPCTDVISTELGSVKFLRLGNSADFVNNGRARIEAQVLKKGAKFKTEPRQLWVKPETLSMPAPEEPTASPQRKSPRIQIQDSPQAPQQGTEQQQTRPCLPELAPHERARKQPPQKDAPIRGRHSSSWSTGLTSQKFLSNIASRSTLATRCA